MADLTDDVVARVFLCVGSCGWVQFLPANESTGAQVFAGSLVPFFSAVADGRKRPSFTWVISEDGHSITVGNFSVAPATVSVWAATTTDGFRDFRLYNCRTGVPGHNCTGAAKGLPGGPAAHVVKYSESAATKLADGVW